MPLKDAPGRPALGYFSLRKAISNRWLVWRSLDDVAVGSCSYKNYQTLVGCCCSKRARSRSIDFRRVHISARRKGGELCEPGFEPWVSFGWEFFGWGSGGVCPLSQGVSGAHTMRRLRGVRLHSQVTSTPAGPVGHVGITGNRLCCLLGVCSHTLCLKAFLLGWYSPQFSQLQTNQATENEINYITFKP